MKPRSIRRTSMFIAVSAIILALALLAPGCQRKKKAGPPPPTPVSVAVARLQDVPLDLRAIGTVQASSSVEVRPQVSGQLVTAAFREGQDLRAGDLLFQIDPRPFQIALKQAEAAQARDEAQLRNADAQVVRNAQLVAKDFITKEAYDQLKANADVLRATVQADQAAVENARLQLGYCTIRSPIDGRAGARMVDPGNLVSPTGPTPLVTIYRISPIEMSFSVPQQNLATIQDYRSRAPLQVQAFPGGQNAPPAAGELYFVDNTVNPTTGTILLKARFPNQDRSLWPGQFVNVVMTLTTQTGVVTVPSVAVQTGQNGTFVMVVRTDRTVAARPVVVDRTVGDASVIRSGLKAGETVVTDGLLRLVSGMRVDIRNPVQGRP